MMAKSNITLHERLREIGFDLILVAEDHEIKDIDSALERAYRMGKRDERKARTLVGHEEMVKWWLGHYIGKDGLCILCGNTGVLRGSGQSAYCMCPNGQALEKAS